MQRQYIGDDRCPKCEAVYCTDWAVAPDKPRQPDVKDTVKCLGCGHTDKLDTFVRCYNNWMYPSNLFPRK